MTLLLWFVGVWLLSAAIVLNIAHYAPTIDDDFHE
jgi:hypothetical protein